MSKSQSMIVFACLVRLKMEEQTVDPTTVSDRAEFTKMLKKREKEAIRNQINANKIFNKQEQERKERLSQTGKAWEAALRLLKKPHSPSKSANSTTSSMETHVSPTINSVMFPFCLLGRPAKETNEIVVCHGLLSQQSNSPRWVFFPVAHALGQYQGRRASLGMTMLLVWLAGLPIVNHSSFLS